jgi:phage baseplate assembly protein W
MSRDINLLYTGTDNRTKKGFNSSIKKITGVQVLLQKIAKLLLTQIGSDLFSPSAGTNIKNTMIDPSVTEDQMTSYVNIAVSQVEDSIMREQVNLILDDEERLTRMDLQSVKKTNNSDWEIEVLVVTSLNDTYLVRL